MGDAAAVATVFSLVIPALLLLLAYTCVRRIGKDIESVEVNWNLSAFRFNIRSKPDKQPGTVEAPDKTPPGQVDAAEQPPPPAASDAADPEPGVGDVT